MTPSPARDRPDPPRRRPWPWVVLVLALAWVVLVRVPLVVNAGHHLDSDLAVDGLTLAAAVDGQWRWHYPGTPYIGIPPVLLSYPQALVFGANPRTLVSGGVVAYALIVVATFLLARRAFGTPAAAWGLLPLAFASTGIVWLSGRITGGHLLAVAWHAAALAIFHEAQRRGGAGRAALLGFWCGLGVYLDGMLAFTALAIVAAGIATWIVVPGTDRWWGWTAGAFVLAFLVGYAPRAIGERNDPHNAYGDQFATIFTADPAPDDPSPPIDWERAKLLAEQHAGLLLRDCLPRLIAGHRLPGYESDPDPATLGAPANGRPTASGAGLVAVLATWLSLGLAAVAAVALLVDLARSRDAADVAVRLALLSSSGLVVVAFLIHRHIYNSDNYRYLVLLIVPWAIGAGIALGWLSRRGSGGRVAAVLVAGSFATLMTLDTHAWYARFGWVDGLRPARVEQLDPALDWLRAHPEVSAIFGDYWDVYRLAFLTGGQIRGVPYPNYPNRFPEWSRDLPAGRPRTLIARPTGLGPFYERSARDDGARELYRDRAVRIYHWP